ncbi:MAG: hypothetical protein OMM_04286 [Candidatus Magnetoglobus multicellularis str. Araruama]|uniref:Uncharacterized protein n=1 Tax=Candidatus Magnetoglobus multicellularis str. Araruama TaxID=890399 RepID=A0A1V1P257_9BACT|nr:MAG: hypothetical protein OMM_04286 [Candidatus Magnetoglobus multicellularis str. Araruama]
MKNKDFTNLLPELFFGSLRKQLMIGILPVDTVIDLLHPVLENFNQVFPKLPAAIQYDLKIILSLYPEIVEKYEIQDIVTLKCFLYKHWRSLYLSAIRFKRKVKNRFKRQPYIDISVPARKMRPAWAVVYAGILLAIGLTFYTYTHQKSNLISSNNIVSQITTFTPNKFLFHMADNQSILAFSNTTSTTANTIKTGLLIASLELSIQTDQSQYISKILDLLKRNVQDHPQLVKPFLEYQADYQNADINALQKQFELFFEASKQLDSYRLGEWCAVAQAILSSKNIDWVHAYFSHEQRDIIQNYLKKSGTKKCE